MSLTLGVVNNQALDDLIQSSLESEHKLKWIPHEEIVDIKPTQIDSVYYDIHKQTVIMLGNSEECIQTLVSEFARIYSLPTHTYNNDVNHFRRYKWWLHYRNILIEGFTKYDDNYYMVADRKFYHCYSRYGFCTACGILRCSPAWCICGHKQLSDGWTSDNKQLDVFIMIGGEMNA